MKVLHVVPDIALESGGQSAAAISLCEGLARAGVDVVLLTTDYRMNGARPPAGVDLHAVPCAFSRWRWSPALRGTLARLLGGAQVVHVHGVWLYPIWAAARLSRDLGVPYLLRPCGMLERWSLSRKAWRKRVYAALLERRTLQGAAALHFTADAERVRSETFGSRAPACVVPLGLPRTAYEALPPPGAFRRRLPELAGKRLVLFLGRLHDKKQPDLLLRAFDKLARDFPDAALVLAGPGDARYVGRLRSEARRLGLEKRVVFPGLLQGRAVQEALVDADLFVLPSLQENFGLAVAEAMAAGCPVVVTPEVALAPEIEKWEAGLVVEADAGAVADGVQRLLRDGDLRQAMGRNGRQLVLERFTWERVAAEMLGVYEDLLQGTRTSPAWR